MLFHSALPVAIIFVIAFYAVEIKFCKYLGKQEIKQTLINHDNSRNYLHLSN